MSLSWDGVEPNRGHLAIVELEKLGKLKFLISQNIDNLHLKSGIAPELLAETAGFIEGAMLYLFLISLIGLITF